MFVWSGEAHAIISKERQVRKMEVEPIRIKAMEVVNDSSYPDPRNEHDLALLRQMGADISTLNCGNRSVVYIMDKPFFERLSAALKGKRSFRRVLG